MHSEASLSNTVLTIPYISGDGIGPEIWQAAQPVIDAAVKQAYGPKRRIHWQEVLAGEKAFRQTGEWLPQSTLTTIQEAKIALKGPLTTPLCLCSARSILCRGTFSFEASGKDEYGDFP